MNKSDISASEIAMTTEPLVEVEATPGSGKTHALIRRAKHLLKTIPASKILVLSFSRAAVHELKRRMSARSDPNSSESESVLSSITVQTAHAFALTLVQQKQVLTSKQERELLVLALEAVKSKYLSNAKSNTAKAVEQIDQLLSGNHVNTILQLISVARASTRNTSGTLSMSRFNQLKPYSKIIKDVRAEYTAQKRARKSVDYGDMLVRASSVLKTIDIPYTHVLVDEYQDCSPAQTKLLVQLADKGCHLMTFGDPAQAIFAFSGAHYTPLSSVIDDVKQMSLPTSHRLTAQTAALASAIAGLENPIQTYQDGEQPHLFNDKSQTKQTLRIVKHINELMGKGVAAADIVVLARTRASLHPVESLLLGQGAPTARRASIRKRVHVLRVLKLVRFIERWEREQERAPARNKRKKIQVDMLRTTLPNGIADDDHWQAAALELKKSLRTPSFDGRYILCAKAYLRLMGGIRADKELLADVNRWAPISRGYKSARAMTSAIKNMTTATVTTSTIHSAKGGEWKHVYIVGATEGLLPIHYACDEREIVEERNLMYVAITRAKSTVSVYHAPTYYARGRQQFDGLSRFLADPDVRKTLAIG